MIGASIAIMKIPITQAENALSLTGSGKIRNRRELVHGLVLPLPHQLPRMALWIVFNLDPGPSRAATTTVSTTPGCDLLFFIFLFFFVFGFGSFILHFFVPKFLLAKSAYSLVHKSRATGLLPKDIYIVASIASRLRVQAILAAVSLRRNFLNIDIGQKAIRMVFLDR